MMRGRSVAKSWLLTVATGLVATFAVAGLMVIAVAIASSPCWDSC